MSLENGIEQIGEVALAGADLARMVLRFYGDDLRDSEPICDAPMLLAARNLLLLSKRT